MSERFRLDHNSPEIQYLCQKDKRLAKLISMVGPIDYSTHDNSYAFLVHEIIEQMLSSKIAYRIFSRLESLCDGVVSPERMLLLSDEEIKGTGTSMRKVHYIRGLTDAALAGLLEPERFSSMSDEEVMIELTTIRGIGNWTAKMFLIFELNRLDVLPFEDGAFQQVFKWLYNTNDLSPKNIRKKCDRWKPYSSCASRYFYHALDEGFTSEDFQI